MADEKFQRFLYSYDYKGGRWGGEIMATSFEDAKKRLSRLQFATVPAEAGSLVSLVAAKRDELRRRLQPFNAPRS